MCTQSPASCPSTRTSTRSCFQDGAGTPGCQYCRSLPGLQSSSEWDSYAPEGLPNSCLSPGGGSAVKLSWPGPLGFLFTPVRSTPPLGRPLSLPSPVYLPSCGPVLGTMGLPLRGAQGLRRRLSYKRNSGCSLEPGFTLGAVISPCKRGLLQSRPGPCVFRPHLLTLHGSPRSHDEAA